MKDSFNK